jgi:glucose-fructose oxidoreductase
VHFAQCVRANRRPEPSGIEGLIDVAIIEAIHHSIATGGWVALEVPRKRRRPSMRQEMRRPAVPREPALVQAESGHS